MSRLSLLVAAAALSDVPAGHARAQARELALQSAAELRLHYVVAEAAVLGGRRGLRLTLAPDAPRDTIEVDELARVEGVDFSSGVIEVEVAGTPAPGAFEGARGFVGIAFRLQDDWKTYDAFYIRPTNGRADDQVRRNHAAQYISHPQWPWSRLRAETPSKYEAYVDVVPGEWTKLRVVVDGERARLYVHDNAQPTLVVNDLKTGPQGRGAVALWAGAGTIGYYRNLRITPASGQRPRPGRHAVERARGRGARDDGR